MKLHPRHPARRPAGRALALLGLLFVASVGLLLLLPSQTPVSMASRLLQSAIDTPTVAAPQITDTPPAAVQPTQAPVEPTQPAVIEQPTQPPAQTPAAVQPIELPTSEAIAQPVGEEPLAAPTSNRKLRLIHLIDAGVLMATWVWLACGGVVLLVLAILALSFYLKSRKPRNPPTGP